MLAFVPVIFDAYRLLKPRMWPVMQALVAHADRAGRCWPSVRRIAEITGVPRSTVSRYLAALERAGHVSRTRKPGGAYTYQIAAKWLPAAVSPHRKLGVSPTRAEENSGKQKGSLTRFARSEMTGGDLPDDAAKWEARLRSWRKSRFWLPQWGGKPGEADCFAPAALIQASL